MYIRAKEVYSVEAVLSKFIVPNRELKVEDTLVDFDGDLISMDSHRYWNFSVNGCVCVECGLKGTYFAKEKSHVSNIRYHFNLYGINSDGEEVMLTKDHIVAKSKGGKDHVSNYQPMCSHCNWLKDSFEGETLENIKSCYAKLKSMNLEELYIERDNFVIVRDRMLAENNDKDTRHLLNHIKGIINKVIRKKEQMKESVAV